MKRDSMQDRLRAELAEQWMTAQASVLSFICAAIPRIHDAQDVLQQVAVEAARGYERYDSARPFVAWCIGIARHKVAQFYRQHESSVSIFSESALEQLANLHVDETCYGSAMFDALESCVDRLDAKAVMLLRLKYTQCLATDKIAMQMSMETGTVRSALRRIRIRLHECIIDRLATEGSK